MRHEPKVVFAQEDALAIVTRQSPPLNLPQPGVAYAAFAGR
jgi:hypothetical protein